MIPKSQDQLDGETLMTKGEAATMARVDVRTIDRWMASGRLKFKKYRSGTIRILKIEVKKAMDIMFDEQKESDFIKK